MFVFCLVFSGSFLENLQLGLGYKNLESINTNENKKY